ncbi:Mut7-C RNAse domain-containing protein [Streptomyces silvisoli]|uniref:Mut7-C RNAse domain-containing protein n=1 Tax=Streptomyces silvisoli TaxID=3034235 RepID=A0ABT5ZNZ4_9ACTN|nr:Mut7-C RNAse domain-containing protein [Streptomyces silvisoli]MDF3291381.1 Mut7-C RNAse domain-containing protein [Streptomyces silvisoli]
MSGAELRVCVADDLRFFLAARNRGASGVRVAVDGTSSLGHVVQSIGVPLTEVGGLEADGQTVPDTYRPRGGELVRVREVRRPQRVADARFVLDVHLGALARRLRLVGLDTAYRNDMDDDALITQANGQGRVLLTQDRGLLFRRSLWCGAFVRGSRPDAQLADVLHRFAPTLAPWTRCMACNGGLEPVSKDEVVHLLQPGTRRTYDAFVRCRECGQVYWHGAHHGRLDAIVTSATRTAGTWMC